MTEIRFGSRILLCGSGGAAILKRSSLLSFLLLGAIALVGVRTYEVWRRGALELPAAARKAEPVKVEPVVKRAGAGAPVPAKGIVERNLFDPERGAGQMPEGVSSPSASLQRIQSMVLVGTAIFDKARYAILQETGTLHPAAPRGQAISPTAFRLKQGDVFDGFTLSDVEPHRVVFTKGASRVEVAIDFLRRVEESPQKPPTVLMPPRPAPAPGAPRRPSGEAAVPRPNP